MLGCLKREHTLGLSAQLVTSDRKQHIYIGQAEHHQAEI